MTVKTMAVDSLDNRVANLTITTTPASRAIYTQTGLADMGRAIAAATASSRKSTA